MHSGVAQCRNCWRQEHPTHAYRAQGAKCQKCGGSHRAENHRLLAWCCKANSKSNPPKEATADNVLFFFCSSIYYMVLSHSLWQTIYNKQPIVLEASEDKNPLYRQIEILLQSEEIRNEIQIKVTHNQPTNNASKFREIYHTENRESKETENLSTVQTSLFL